VTTKNFIGDNKMVKTMENIEGNYNMKANKN